jgi:hypothetical protein
MRKAVLAVLAVLCSVSGTGEETTTHFLANAGKDTEQSMLAGCGGGSSSRSSRRGRRCTDCEKSTLAGCRKGRRCAEKDASILAGKCKGGNCNRRGVAAVA